MCNFLWRVVLITKGLTNIHMYYVTEPGPKIQKQSHEPGSPWGSTFSLLSVGLSSISFPHSLQEPVFWCNQTADWHCTNWVCSYLSFPMCACCSALFSCLKGLSRTVCCLVKSCSLRIRWVVIFPPVLFDSDPKDKCRISHVALCSFGPLPTQVLSPAIPSGGTSVLVASSLSSTERSM